MAQEEVEAETGPHFPRGKVTIKFGELILSSNFDSGNIDRIEECKRVDVDTREFDLWTAPDCAGTEFENCNRTWFHFSVSIPANFGTKILRFNIQNLNKQSRLYQQGLTPMIKTCPGRGVWERLRDRPEYESVEGGSLKLSFQLNISETRKHTTYVAFCFPFSYSECQRMLAKLEAKYSSEVEGSHDDSDDTCSADESRIYFHRELLCKSLENRHIDLITVSSYEGISPEREPRLPALFPLGDCCVRARKFPKKKVFYVTSRVHPGESPSSHVFNGFLHFILRPDDPRAQVLRRHFVFKLIPMLNPDGVFHGHYRTDTRGVNLNRVYLDPSPELHPSIYAARSLMLHYHKKGESCQRSSGDDRYIISLNTNGNCNNTEGSKTELLSLSERGCTCVCSLSEGLSGWCSDTTANRHREVTTSASTATAARSNFKRLKELHTASMNALNYSSHCHTSSAGSKCSSKNASTTSSPALLLIQNSSQSVATKQVTKATPTRFNKCNNEGGICHKNDDACCGDSDISDALSTTRKSGIAFYVDLHAHATKRGVFLYGNYFGSAQEQAENMLFPKVISLNSPHFDFEHCVFSAKNMYTADKRDGMSKEGSGRVAMHKATGIIHCYTLECNYNSGRQCNALTAATLDNGRASPSLPCSSMARKFSIQDFEQVGRALAISALDMCHLNPWSRIPTTEYRSVDGVRQSLLQRIRTARLKKSTASSKGRSSANELLVVSSDHTTGLPSSDGSVPANEANHDQEVSASQDMMSSSLSSSSISRTLLLQRQKVSSINKSDQIALGVARLTEAKRKHHHGRQLQTKAGLTALQGRRAGLLKGTRSSSMRRQRVEEQSQPYVVKASLQQVVLPTCNLPMRLQADPLKDQLPPLEHKDSQFRSMDTHLPSSSGECSIKSHIQLRTESNKHFFRLPPRKKLLNRRSRNVHLPANIHAQKDSISREKAGTTSQDQLTVSDSEIICKLSRPTGLQLRRSRALTSTQARH